MRIRGAGKHVCVQAIDKFVGGIGEVAGYLLFDRASFVRPLLFGVVYAAQAGGLGLESHVKIGGGNGGEILGDILLRIGIVPAAQLGVDGGGLIRGHAGAAAKCHVLLSMGRPGKPGGVSSPPTLKFSSTVTTGASALRTMTTCKPLDRWRG
jgi:hypothetical protein